MCTCPDGYVGQFCESCAPGFRHEPANGGPFAPCVPCNCNGHADICDPETGECHITCSYVIKYNNLVQIGCVYPVSEILLAALSSDDGRYEGVGTVVMTVGNMEVKLHAFLSSE
jgi:hypothetical protein